MKRLYWGAFMALCTVFAHPATAQDWAAQKCALYALAVEDALVILGREGLADSFLAQNAEFIASGCVAPRKICGTTRQELDFANMLTIMTMNEGMASTFVPFGCD